MVVFYITAGLDDDGSGFLQDANGNAIAITAGSDVLYKVMRGAGATPDLDINGTALAGGSVTTFNTATSGANKGLWTVSFHAADTTSLVPGVYDVKVGLVDAGDGNRFKWVDDGVLYVEGAVAGKVT